MHKDLVQGRSFIENAAKDVAKAVFIEGDSLALAREAWINAFDKAAEELEA